MERSLVPIMEGGRASSTGIAENRLIRRLGLTEELFKGDISAYELGNRVPDLHTLLLLANAVGVFVDMRIDDSCVQSLWC
jgi:transcriptional regulator with XRE-family HTH domain